MAKKVSKKALVAFLNEKFGKSITEEDLSYEAYGRKVYAYIWNTQELLGATRKQINIALIMKGIATEDSDWCPGNDNRVSIPVTYFKAWHWDE